MTDRDILTALVTQAGGASAFARTFRYRTSVTGQCVRDWLRGDHPINTQAAQALRGIYRHAMRQPVPPTQPEEAQ